MEYLQKSEVNNGRQPELDIARGLAVLFMVMIHMQEYFSDITATEGIIGTIVDFLGGIPAAPVFMVLMGIGFVYSKRSTPDILWNRGVRLIGLGYLLNLLRGTLPYLFQFFVYGSSNSFELSLTNLIYVDIFQFSGMAMIFFGFVKKYDMSDKALVIMMFLFSILNQAMVNIKCNSLIMQSFTGLFWGSSEYSFFPFLTWIFYPIFGFLFGKILIRVSNKNKFYFRATILGFLSFASLIAFCTLTGIDSFLFNDELYYHHQFLGNIISASFVIGWIGSMFCLNGVLHDKLKILLNRWSNNVTEIYFIHWIIIGWLVQFIGTNNLSFAYMVVLILGVFVISDIIADYYLLMKNKDLITK